MGKGSFKLVATMLAFYVLSAGCAKTPRNETVTPKAPVCKAPQSTVRPLVISWSAAERASLAAASENGVIIVGYDGCELVLLDDCRLPGKYVLKPSTPTTERVSFTSVSELRDQLPVVSQDLERRLVKSGPLALDYVVVGTRNARVSDRSKGMIVGACEAATHFVRGMVVGAYELTDDRTGAQVRKGGNTEACQGEGGGAGSGDCGAVVQLVLTPLEEMTSDRDDLYDDVHRTMEADETLNALQMLKDMMEHAGEAAAEGGAPAPVPAELENAGPVVESLMALPDGGSDPWDDKVKAVMLKNFDTDKSGAIDNMKEVSKIPCNIFQALDMSIQRGRGGASALRTTYGFPARFQWVGYALGFDEKVRALTDARLENCGL